MVTKDLFTLHWTAWLDRWAKTAPREDVTTRLFYETVSEAMGDEQFERASKVLFRDNEFFPTPRQVIDAGGDRPMTEDEQRRYILEHHRPARLGHGEWAGWKLGAGEHPQIEAPKDEGSGRPPADVLDKLEMLTHPARSLDDIRARNLRMEQYEAEGMKNPPKIELPADFVVGGKSKPLTAGKGGT